MNGYKLIADSYRKLVKEGKIEKEVADKETRVLDFLATCNSDDICRLFSSGAFNDITKGYLSAAIKEAGLDDEAAASLRESLHWVLDTRSASDVMK